MKKLHVLLAFILTVLATFELSAQDYPQRMHNGKMSYVYTVAPGNTLYGIARSFSANVDQVVAANPETSEGLSIGQEVFVPLDAIDKRAAKTTEVKLEGQFILHTVQRKETLFSIAKIYNIGLNELQEANPEAVETLSTGSVIKVPMYQSKGVDEIHLEPARNDTFVVHQVRTGETLFSISKTYVVSVDSLKKANKGTIDNGVEADKWIVIPKYNDAFKATIVAQQKEESIYPSGKSQTYRIALMLPFELYQRDSISKDILTGKKLPLLTEISLEVHRGVQLALDSLRQLGFNAEVFVYDVGEDVVDARQAVKRPEMKDMHLIIGPLHKASLAVVSDASKENHTYIVSPNTFSNEIFEGNPYLFRAAPSKETMMKYLATYVAGRHQRQNVLMVSSERQADLPYRKLFEQFYNESLYLIPNDYSDTLRIANKRSFDGANIHTLLRKDVQNILVIPSNELAFVSDFMTRLSRLRADGYEIQVYGLEQWVGYDNIELEYKNRFKLKLVVPSFIEFKSPEVVDFLTKYRAAFETEPHKMNYGFMGYDLMMFFGLAMQEHGLGFAEKLNELEFSGVNGNYRFGRTKGKDFENKAVSIIEYNNFEVNRVN